MSFSNLVGGGAECGPSNPLATLGKRLGQDNALQRDRYGPGGSSSSAAQSGMRSTQGGPNSAAQEQSAFFGRPGPGPGPVPYDMSPLQQALPPHGHHADAAQRAAFEHSFRNQPQPQQMSGPTPSMSMSGANVMSPAPAWAQDFLKSSMQQNQQQQPQSPSAVNVNPLQRPAYSAQFGAPMGAMQWGGATAAHYPTMQTGLHAADSPHAAVHAANQHKQTTAEPAWATAFAAFDQQHQQHESMDTQQEQQGSQPQEVGVEPEQQQRPLNTIEDADELAQTAGRLMETIAHEEDTKFKQSRFLDLMRRLRDREAGIEGTEIVDTDPNAPAAAMRDVKGKGRAMPNTAIEEYQTRLRGQYQPSQRGMDLAGEASMRAPSQDAMAEMNDIWAEEDALREESKKGAFVGDAGDVAARMAEDDAAAREFERYQRLGAQIPGSHSAEWAESLGQVGTGTDTDAYTSYAPQFGAGSGAFNELRRAAMREPLVQHPHPELAQQGETVMEEEQGEEEEDGIKSTDDFVGRKWEGSTGRGRAGHQSAEWDTLQRDWDAFEATSMGIRPVGETGTKARSPSFSQFTSTQPQPYRFAPNNPYQGRTKHHLSHWDGLHKSYATPPVAATMMEDSVLEREAAVQDDPTNAQAWYDLGVKQQENEREGLAISALHRAVQLDPKLRGAWLALAVSYTNENDRPAALEAIVRWMDSVEEYSDVLAGHRAEIAAAEKQQQQRPPRDGTHSPISSSGSLTPDGLTASAKHQRVTEALIALARHGSTQGQVDADVQVALGVLFNSSEDYDKAVDCFGTALSVRPDDWLLYNRMGATLSNSGRSDEAIKFYHHALSLQPEFVRCHFNLSISYLNLKMYRETAQHIYTALNLQRAESASNNGKAELQQLGNERELGGVASSSLWETFRVSLELLNRPDLARLCARRDIDAFDPNDFVDPEHDAMAEA
ncbi:hypothetical protein A4X13_0g863 [Tilletia indica]|uniref:Peroxin-5 n=1 Tax=Tilletia indica TaxID=43049 RepID=A0A177TFY4_9BASI|nr:hypothetical protein A4X13_0g863 [Tilletia indica]